LIISTRLSPQTWTTSVVIDDFDSIIRPNTIGIGAPSEGSAATGVNGDQSRNRTFESGAAYVFTRSGTSWSQQNYLKASNTGGRDEFGGSVSVSGNIMVVGASGENSNATGVNGDQADNSVWSGAAYVFVNPTNSLVGGDVSGLVGSLSLQNNGADEITLNMDGPFTFSAQHDGSTYEVTISSQPASQVCTVANGSGTLAGINNVSVSCKADNIFTNGFEAPDN